MVFFGCSEFQWTKFTWKLLLWMKRYQSKNKVFWNAWAIGFQMVKLKNLFCTKIIVHDFAQKCQCSWIFGKTKFLGKCLFHREMFCVTNFLLVLRICIVNVMIFIKKNIDKLVQDQFLQPLKDHLCNKFGYVGKMMPCFFSSNKQKLNLVVKNLNTCVRAYWKYAGMHILGFVISKFSFCLFEEKNMCLLFHDFKENWTFQKVLCFSVKCLVWLILNLP